MLVYVVIVVDSLTDTTEVEGVYQRQQTAEDQATELMNQRLSLSAYVVEKEII